MGVRPFVGIGCAETFIRPIKIVIWGQIEMTARFSCKRILLLWLLAACGLLGGASAAQGGASPIRERILMDAGWRFALGNARDPHKDFDFAQVPFFIAKAG